MTGYLLDTDFALWHLKDESPQRILLKLLGEGGVPCVSAFSFYEISSEDAFQNNKRAEKVKEFLSRLKICAVDSDIAELAGKLFRENNGLSLGGAFVSATCLRQCFTLVTRHPENYPVQGLKCFVPEKQELSHAERIAVS